jgi:hypothetical protein
MAGVVRLKHNLKQVTPPSSPTPTPVCNTVVDGQEFYTDLAGLGKSISASLGTGIDIFSMVTGCCCFMLFLILSITSSGPMNFGKVLIYICTLCSLFTILSSAINYSKHKEEIKKAIKAGRPCEDKSGTIIN